MIKNSGYAASVAATAAGVTLIELLVTLSIMAILLGVAIPSLVNFITDSRQSSRAFELVGALNLARSEAIKRGVRVTLCKTTQPDASIPACDDSAGWEQGWIIFVDNTQDIGNELGVIDGLDTPLRVFPAEPSIAITAGGNFVRGVIYDRSGLGLGIKADGGTGTASNTFLLCRDGKATSIITNRSGRVKIAQGQC